MAKLPPRWFATVSHSQAEGTYRLDFGAGDIEMALFGPLADIEEFAQQIIAAVAAQLVRDAEFDSHKAS